jgi:hypothetical protein
MSRRCPRWLPRDRPDLSATAPIEITSGVCAFVTFACVSCNWRSTVPSLRTPGAVLCPQGHGWAWARPATSDEGPVAA